MITRLFQRRVKNIEASEGENEEMTVSADIGEL
jgi:hypothetical protein